MKSLLSAAALIALAAPVLAQQNPMVGGAEMPATNDIVTNALNSADHTTLVAAVQAAGLVETLQGEGPFTVFAPTNDAFAALPAGTVENLLLPENKETLTKVLTCHVVADELFSSEIAELLANGGVELTDEMGGTSTVTIADVDQSNGVIHVVDAVLLPAM